jgi:hypothetical protein
MYGAKKPIVGKPVRPGPKQVNNGKKMLADMGKFLGAGNRRPKKAKATGVSVSASGSNQRTEKVRKQEGKKTLPNFLGKMVPGRRQKRAFGKTNPVQPPRRGYK